MRHLRKWFYNAGANETKSSHHDAGDMILTVHSKDGGDEVYLTLTADIIYAMACAGEGTPKGRLSFLHALKMVVAVDTPAECAFASVKEDIPMPIKMSFTVGTCR